MPLKFQRFPVENILFSYIVIPDILIKEFVALNSDSSVIP